MNSIKDKVVCDVFHFKCLQYGIKFKGLVFYISV